MRRKSERNKSKGSPEKKVEKATRKSTRRRGKRATSSSPEREDGEGKSTQVSKDFENSEKESTVDQPAATTAIDAAVTPTTTTNAATTTTTTTRLKIKELKTIAEEDTTSNKLINSGAAIENIAASPSGDKNQEGIIGEGASVWKVARADASPGEIQKLKLCRQRNPSEASDSSSSRKKSSHKSYESGEGDVEEGDSAEDLPRSRKSIVDFSRSDRLDDLSSHFNPGAQDRKEEVSLCSQVLPRNTTTSSPALNNFLLSDDDGKKNLDLIDEKIHDEDDQKVIRLENNDQLVQNQADTTHGNEPSYNGDDFKKDNKEDDNDDKHKDIIDKNNHEEGGKTEEDKEEEPVVTVAETIAPPPAVDDVKVKEKPEIGKESSGEESGGKKESPEPTGEIKTQGKRPAETRTSSRTIVRRKHRSKYHESSDSETPESEDEQPDKKPAEEEETRNVDEKEEAKTVEEVQETGNKSPDRDNRLSVVEEEPDGQKNLNESEDRVKTNSVDDKTHDESSVPAPKDGYKPPKVNLKRSFSVRQAETDEAVKKEDAEKNGESQVPLQVKENNGAPDETDVKSLPRKRRWGTTITAEVTPAFTVSTDSLKALVPGAKPLSITEVRLSKDDDEEKARRREREKRHSVGDDPGDKKPRDDVQGPKIDREIKKGDLKHDNHIGAKRKISILKDTPRVKSPSPPSAKATNVLLIKNLVRPFTLNQIKELLSRTGTIVENGFWIDGIKSKCFVVYANEDQAFETRQALHGISWPVSNPKRLQVEYTSQEDMDLARELSKDQPVQRKAEPLLGGDNWQQVWAREEKQNAATKVTTVREWDLGKEDGSQIKEKEREKKDLEKKRRQRSRSPPIEPHLPPPARKFKKKEDEPPPAKLLDDLFKKTKAIPCIYWLPLTNEQIVVKEEMRRQHMAEHARRLEEMKRAERSRDPGSRRRRSPRK